MLMLFAQWTSDLQTSKVDSSKTTEVTKILYINSLIENFISNNFVYYQKNSTPLCYRNKCKNLECWHLIQ